MIRTIRDTYKIQPVMKINPQRFSLMNKGHEFDSDMDKKKRDRQTIKKDFQSYLDDEINSNN